MVDGGRAIRFDRAMMQMRLFVPANGDRISGGHAYDRRMLAALRAAGHDAEAVLVDESNAAEVWQALPPAAVAVIDAQTLEPFLPLADALRARDAAVLVHHPAALEPGLSAAAHQSLRRAEQEILPTLSRIVVASEAVAARLNEAFGISYTQLAIVPPGVDVAPRSRVSAVGCRILSVGALVPRKGHDVLLRALGRLGDLDWQLTIVGTKRRHPVHAAALQALAGELAIADRVRFAADLGVDGDDVDDAALDSIWRDTDLFALATHWEATPGATADALRRGIPAAVCAGGAAASLITPQAGSVVPTGDAEGLSKALRRMIFDGDLRREMADAAWQLGAGLPTWQVQAAALLTALSAAKPIR